MIYPRCSYIQKKKVFKQVFEEVKTESTRTLSNFYFQWKKMLYQNNLKHIAFFLVWFTFFKA